MAEYEILVACTIDLSGCQLVGTQKSCELVADWQLVGNCCHN